MKCDECQKFDNETKAKMLEIFNADEIEFFAIKTVQENYNSRTAKSFLNANNGKPNNIKAMIHYQRQIDFTGAMLGKLMISLESKVLEEMMVKFKKNGIVINLEHAACPHKDNI